jgi:predicted acetyltransferase
MTESAGTAYPIRPFGPDELDRAHAVDQHAFNGSPLTEAEKRLLMEQMEFDRTLAAFDGDEPVGTAGIYSFQLTVPGGESLPAAGVTWVSVLPTYRRRGVLSSLMRRQLGDIRDRGEPLAVLWASEAAIYSRFGYGRSSWQLSFIVRRGEGAVIPDVCGVRLRVAEPAAALSEMAKIYQTVLPSRPGFFARDDGWWHRLIRDPADQRHGGGPLRCMLAELDGEPQGYVLYTGVSGWEDHTMLPDGALSVRELMAAGPAAGAALWANLLSRDLTNEFRAERRPVDDPLLFQLADPRRARPRLSDALWTRIIDVPAALAGRRYSCPVDVTIEVRDELIPQNAGVWRLTAGEGVPSVSSVSSAPDVTLGVASLGAAYLGGISLGTLAQAGLVTESRPEAVRRLAAAMSWDPAPWCPVIFLCRLFSYSPALELAHDGLVDGVGRQGAVHGEQPLAGGVILHERHGLVQIHLQAALDDCLGVVRAAAPGQQAAHQFVARHVEVHRHLHGHAQSLRGREGRLGLLHRAREPVEHVAAGLRRGDHRLAHHVHHHGVRHQVAEVDVGSDRLAERRGILDVLAQQVAAGQVRDAEPAGQASRLGSLAGAGGADQQQAQS